MLADSLHVYACRPNCIVLALPRGGVPVGAAVAKQLKLPLDVFLVRKIGVPGYEELAMGAIASGGVRVLNENVLASLPDAKRAVEDVTAWEIRELTRREAEYRAGLPPLDVKGKTVLLVDDGVATGASMRAAVTAVRKLGAMEVVVAVPVGSPSTCELIEAEADSMVCPLVSPYFEAVGQYYSNFSQTSDAEVCTLLAEARRRHL